MNSIKKKKKMKIKLLCHLRWHFFATLLILPHHAFTKAQYSPKRLSQLSGEKINQYDSKSQWDEAYARPTYLYGKAPAKFLADNYAYLAPESKVLDMGMGEGRNAVFLAQKGHKVTGIDISSVAVRKSQALAKEYGVKIKAIVASLEKYKIEEGSYDAIISFYYVDRSLIEKIKKWLRPGGIVIYEAFTQEQKKLDKSKEYSENQYLKSAELLEMFNDMRLLKFEEPLHENVFRSSAIFKKK